MDLSAASELVSLLAGGALRTRTAVLNLGHDQLGQETELAARLQVDLIRTGALLLGDLAPGRRLPTISATLVERLLDRLTNSTGQFRVVLVADFDLCLASMTPPERADLWDNLYGRFSRKPRGLLLALPQAATWLAPTDGLRRWEQDRRIVTIH
jgi:hypothetical protein